MAVFTILICLFFFFPSVNMYAAGPAQPLEALLKTSPPDTTLSVIVVLKDRVDIEGLRSAYSIAGEDFATRHLKGIDTLKAKAASSQGAILSFLKGAMGRGSVRDFRPYWIVNAVLVEAYPMVVSACSGREDVDRVVLNRKTPLPSPVDSAPAPLRHYGLEPNLGVIGADSLWRLGYTGRGVLVCSFDSGVDADHPALSGKWRGAMGFPPSECWFDPFNHSSRPLDDDLAGGVTHGTGVMSIILGSSGSDTVGVAPGATWIAANAFEADAGGAEVTTTGILLDCFEWAADPDGDPKTVADVPRVINNSWGTNLTNGGGFCDDILYDAIDAVEMLGSAVFFSAGNTGPGDFTIASPASRVASPVNAFAVGAVTNSLQVATYSSRGPSTCDSSTVKPEVVAPGSDIRMAKGTAAGGGYHQLTGTSFSAPHVSGAAALLFGVDPSLTSEEVKYALLNSAEDLGEPGDDNAYGMGVINLPAALREIGTPAVPAISILDIDYRDQSNNRPDPGETLDLVITLRNDGALASGLQAILLSSRFDVRVADSSAVYGDLPLGGEADNDADHFRVMFGESIPAGTPVPLSLVLSWSGGGPDTLRFDSVVGTPVTGGSGEHDIGNVTFTVTNFGQYGYYNGASLVGEGFRFPKDSTNWLFHGAFLAGVGPSQVSDGTDGGESDWRVIPGGNLTFTTSGEIADQEGYAAYDDGGADDPIGIQVLQRSFAWSDNVNNDYVMLVYFIINSSPTEALSNLYTGLYFDWDMDALWYDRNYVDWDPDDALGYMWSEMFEKYMGISLLSHTPTSYRAINNPTYIYDGFTDAEKYHFLTSGFDATRGDTLDDWSQMLSVGPFSMGPGDTMAVAFAVLGGENFSDLRDNARAAQAKYEEIKDLLPSVIIPPSPPTYRKFTLTQNFPNPFPACDGCYTTINYSISASSDSLNPVPVRLEFFDLRGRRVNVAVNTMQPPGEYSFNWYGKDDHGSPLPSGIYFYRLSQGSSEMTRKLVLIH